MSKLPLPTPLAQGLFLCVSLFCLCPVLCCCVLFLKKNHFFSLTPSFHRPFNLLGLKMTELKCWGVKLGLKLFVVVQKKPTRKVHWGLFYFFPFVLFVCSCLMLGVGLWFHQWGGLGVLTFSFLLFFFDVWVLGFDFVSGVG